MRGRRLTLATAAMAAGLALLASYLVYPIVLLLIESFNTAPDILVPPAQWGLANWIDGLRTPGVLESIGHSVQIWFFVTLISLPLAVVIALILARTNIPFSHALESLFWMAFVIPPVASTLGWVMLLAPDWGFLNRAITLLPFVENGPFNIYSVAGIVWVRVMGDGLAFYVILLTPPFRNMDGAFEEAGRVSGASKLKTLLQVTLPMMAAPIVLTLALQLVHVFRGFEVEWILGSRFGYYVYSTLIYSLIRVDDIPRYSQAIVLGSLTLLVIAVIIPIQRWIVGRRQYTTVQGSFRPALIDLGRWRRPAVAGIAFVVVLLTALPIFVLLVGSFMTRVGFFNVRSVWTMRHWENVLGDPSFQSAAVTTLTLAFTAAIVGPLLFSLLAYVIVRTRWRARALLDSMIWASAAMPGILVGLGLLMMFLTTPFLKPLFGTIWVLLIVVVVSGVNTGTNVLKGVMVQIGASLEEAGRVSGAGWLMTYVRVVIPVLMPTLVLIGMLSFVSAAAATSTIIFLASRDTTTLSVLALELGSGRGGQTEQAGIISVLIAAITLAVALPFRLLARRLGVRHDLAVEGDVAPRDVART